MIDIQTYEETNPSLRPTLDIDTRVLKALKSPPNDILENPEACTESDITEEEALLCPATAPGFSFQSQTWARFKVGLLKPIGWRGGMWEKLNMDEERKQYIWKLTANHDWALNVPRDRKDLGLTYLLHGKSGSGKSLTVGKFESVPILGIKLMC